MRSGQKRTARRRGVTFRALVVLPFCVALGIQGVVCATVLARSEILKQMEIDAYDLFSERVASRAGYLENDMIFRWSDFDPVVESATASIDKALAAAQATSADIETGSDLAISIIEATSQDLLAYSHRAEVDGVFLVLADGAEGQSDNRTALYIRDSNPKVEVANGSDLMLAACPISIGRQLGVTLDSMWSATFPLAAEGESRSAFYYEPVRAAERYPEASTNDLGYWGRPVDFGWAGTPSITYSKPIRDAQGGIVGVIGVEVRLDRVASFFRIAISPAAATVRTCWPSRTRTAASSETAAWRRCRTRSGCTRRLPPPAHRRACTRRSLRSPRRSTAPDAWW